jgi:hypothetical protein
MIEAMNYRTENDIASESWVDEVKIRVDGKFKSTGKIDKDEEILV